MDPQPQSPQRALAPFAAPSWAAGLWAIASTLAVVTALALLERRLSLRWALAIGLLQSLVFVRVFVLQHDAGHGGLLPSKVANRIVGQSLSAMTGVPYEPWRAEHAWHHAHQGKLWLRGVDRVNSPVTVREALADPAAARLRERFIKLPIILVGGIHSLFIKRKRMGGFFMFRPGYKGQPPRMGLLRFSFALTVATNLAWHAGLILWLGAARWALGVLVPVLVGGAMGATLFWMQHNFPDGFHAEAGAWNPIDVAVRGSSYLKLPPLLAWCSGNIGLHHVHHLNAKVPMYALEKARRAVPELAAVAPLDWERARRSVRALFWDEEGGRYVGWRELSARLAGVESPQA